MDETKKKPKYGQLMVLFLKFESKVENHCSLLGALIKYSKLGFVEK